MKISFYTIDDLDLGYDPKGVTGYRLSNFLRLDDALIHYSGGYLGTLKIPAIDLSVKVYEGTDSRTLAKGAGHFEDTSIWRGNIAVAAHNRGVNNHFGQLHTLEIGDKVTLTTKLGTKTYEVGFSPEVSFSLTFSTETTS